MKEGGAQCGFLLLSWVAIFRRDPDLLKERQQPGPDAKRWDRILLQIYGWVLLFTLIVALLDVGRFHWSDTVPLWLQIAALLGLMASLAFTGWAMAENRFFSQVGGLCRVRTTGALSPGTRCVVKGKGRTLVG